MSAFLFQPVKHTNKKVNATCADFAKITEKNMPITQLTPMSEIDRIHGNS